VSIELVLIAFVLAFVVLFLFEHQLERPGGSPTRSRGGS